MHPLTVLSDILGEKSTASLHEKNLIQIAQRVARKLAYIPKIRMVALCNSLSFYAGNSESDIDLFIVSAPKYLWFVRTISTLMVWIMGMRRYKKNTKWLVCLSFFATTNGLDFQKIAIENDFYLISWISHLKPLVSYERTYENFIKENAWIESFLDRPTNFKENTKYLARTKKPWWLPFTELFGAPLWRFFDILFKNTFGCKTRASYESLGRPWGVVISENMLKFHPDDRRMELRGEVLGKVGMMKPFL